MKTFLFSLLAVTCFLSLNGQNTFLVEKIGSSRKYAFHTGDFLKIRTKEKKAIVKSDIYHLTDSSVTIGPKTIIPVSDIGAVYKNYHFPKLMSNFLFIGGAGYIILDAVNNLINNKQVFVPQTLAIGGSIMLVGVAIVPFWQRKIPIGVRWKVKILEINVE
jgi:hypothetical protein